MVSGKLIWLQSKLISQFNTTTMKFTNHLLLLLAAWGIIVFAACSDDLQTKIGEQVWATKNLNTATFSNGEPIFEATSFDAWRQAIKEGKPAYCYLDFKPENGDKLGKLYNHYAVEDSRGLAPKGWHIPNRDEWQYLKILPANDLRSTSGWEATDGSVHNGTNKSGFNAMPAGDIHVLDKERDPYRKDGFDGSTCNVLPDRSTVCGGTASWWCADDCSVLYFHFDDNKLEGPAGDPCSVGHYVRCIKDKQ